MLNEADQKLIQTARMSISQLLMQFWENIFAFQPVSCLDFGFFLLAKLFGNAGKAIKILHSLHTNT